MAKHKELKKWNGRSGGEYKRGSFYIAAYTKKQAGELLSRLLYSVSEPDEFLTNRCIREINEFYSPHWGNPMEDINPTEPCVYYRKHIETPTRIL